MYSEEKKGEEEIGENNNNNNNMNNIGSKTKTNFDSNNNLISNASFVKLREVIHSCFINNIAFCYFEPKKAN